MGSSFLVASHQIPEVLGLTETVPPRDALGCFSLMSRRAFAKILFTSSVDWDEYSGNGCLTDSRSH
ncbi:hypothetical protein GMA10_03720 [Kocuria koreensis]|uniref:Uncharacterized protein n=1 Tax=Rothia koreensis TaxID=592378 RepID=A0A7K1LGV0_9MICC|nr:hypothetical protein [Rothia koreensis]MUN54330.1 hypothetical protein [Rothia koreensis]